MNHGHTTTTQYIAETTIMVEVMTNKKGAITVVVFVVAFTKQKQTEKTKRAGRPPVCNFGSIPPSASQRPPGVVAATGGRATTAQSRTMKEAAHTKKKEGLKSKEVEGCGGYIPPFHFKK